MNWIALLSVMQIAYNTSINQITDITLFFINYEYNINLFQELKKVIILIKQVNITMTEMWTLYNKLKQDIKFLLHRSTFYYNKYRSKESMLKKKNKVYLLQKNIKTTRSSSKLDYIKIKSFKIVRNIKEVSFKLKLLEEMLRKHSVFYIFLLKLVSSKMLKLTEILDNYLIK